MRPADARRRKGERFAKLPRHVLQTPAVQTLSHSAFRVLVLLAAEYMGSNNGALGITAKQAFENGIGSHHTFYDALAELAERGLIRMTCFASRIPPRPTMYALTWLSIDDTEYSQSTRKATHDYRKWQPQKVAL